MNRINAILDENARFRRRIDPTQLPPRRPESLAVITCMDPRINLEAIGIPSFTREGAGSSDIRVMRTIGGMAEARSLIIGIFLAGFREVALLMHTDCGCCLAHSKIDTIISNMEARLSAEAMQTFRAQVGEPFRAKLMAYLKVFEAPHEALQREIAAIRAQPFVPDDLLLHGLLYDVETGAIEVVVNGYE